MKFCPECKTRLRRQLDTFRCDKCGYIMGDAPPPEPSKPERDSGFNILGEKDGKEMRPTIKIDCPKCGHDEAVWWMLQTRSADEPTTQFYRCSECSHTWRDYS